MLIKWKLFEDEEIIKPKNLKYDELSRSKNDLGITIEYCADIKDPNSLVVRNASGKFKPECFQFNSKDESWSVYCWDKAR